LGGAAAPATELPPLPPEITTPHTLELPGRGVLPGRTLHFAATAGTLRLRDEGGAPEADIAFIALQLDGANRTRRPVTFVLNGGPGVASGWLQVGAVGPWRIPLGADATAPSASPAPMPNADTWLDFTDLVFIDPAGTGYSRLLGDRDAERRRLWSVQGDIDSLARTIRLWLDRNGRVASPKYILGESYGGFRAPRLASALQTDQGIGVAGLILISPALDLGGRSGVLDPLAIAERLPTMSAAARARKGPVTREQVADAEQYAGGEYVVELLRGERDTASIARRSERVAALTGLDPALVRRYHGEVTGREFVHERDRAQGRVGSLYDATVTGPDPFPLTPFSTYSEPLTEALKAPVSSAMEMIYADELHWRPDALYQLWNDDVGRRGDWGRSRVRPESLTAWRLRWRSMRACRC
ncbi:MAG: peptidase S10, partial [Pseudomonadota bacterium]|nr:peptidase S10 [Pseudomonadota bacterium]